MGKELSWQEMIGVIDKIIETTVDPLDLNNLNSIIKSIRGDLLGENSSHTKYLLRRPQEIIESEKLIRDNFFVATGINSRDSDLS
jgi:hypothetical protein